jgi:hypothetical protein
MPEELTGVSQFEPPAANNNYSYITTAHSGGFCFSEEYSKMFRTGKVRINPIRILNKGGPVPKEAKVPVFKVGTSSSGGYETATVFGLARRDDFELIRKALEACEWVYSATKFDKNIVIDHLKVPLATLLRRLGEILASFGLGVRSSSRG